MGLINFNLDEAEQKLVEAIKSEVLPELTSEVVKQVIPALPAALDGLQITFTVNVSRKRINSIGGAL
jgi:hypothetical protein